MGKLIGNPFLSFLHKLLLFLIFSTLGLIFAPYNVLLSYLSYEKPFTSRSPDKRKGHEAKVRGVVRQIQEWRELGGRLKMCTARPSWQSISTSKTDKRGYFQVDLSKLNDVVYIDYQHKCITVEPGMCMGRLTSVLRGSGYTIPVVPELDSLIVGGLIAGAGIETSSHKWGLFHETALAYEVALPDGNVLTCSREQNSDLFFAIPNSYGTLGFLTSVTLRLIPASSHVRLSYTRCNSIKEAISLMREEHGKHEFVEGLAYSNDKIAVMFGDFESRGEGLKTNPLNSFYKPFFFEHVEGVIDGWSEGYEELVPIKDYYHRHSRSVFWLIPVLFTILQHKTFRLLFGLITPRHVNVGASVLPTVVFNSYKSAIITQDYIVDFEVAEEFFYKANKLMEIFPIWLCPTKMGNEPGMFPKRDKLMLDLGYYGVPKNKDNIPTIVHELELMTIQAKGFSLLYADCYMSSDELREMYDTRLYDKMRSQIKSVKQAFPDVHDKISPLTRGLAKK